MTDFAALFSFLIGQLGVLVSHQEQPVGRVLRTLQGKLPGARVEAKLLELGLHSLPATAREALSAAASLVLGEFPARCPLEQL